MKVDTVRLYTAGTYKLNERYFEVKEGIHKGARLNLEDNNYIKRVKYYNDEQINIEENRVITMNGEDITQKPPLYINISIPKILNGASNTDYSIEQVDKVNKSLRDIIQDKVDIDIDTLRVGRLDIYKNIQYNPSKLVLFLLNLKTYNGHFHKTIRDEMQGVNVLYYNKGRELNIYDKVREQKAKGIKIPGPLTRSEIRLKRAGVISKQFGKKLEMKDVFELLKAPDTLKKVYNDNIQYILKGLDDEDGNEMMRGVDTIKDLIYASMNEDQFLNGLEILYRDGKIPRTTYYRHINKFVRARRGINGITMKEIRGLLLYE